MDVASSRKVIFTNIDNLNCHTKEYYVIIKREKVLKAIKWT